MGFWHGYTPGEGKGGHWEKVELLEEVRHGREGGSGDDGRVVELLRPLQKWHIDNLNSKMVKRVIAPWP